jgi:hypothetical protein
MRQAGEGLKRCPLCGEKTTPGALGLRDYRWVNPYLPGRVGLMDIDGCLNQLKTDRVLMFEYKPGHAPISKGASITFDILWRKGIDVLVVWEHSNDLVTWQWWFDVNKVGSEMEQEEGTRDDLGQVVRDWWDAG